MWSEAEIHVYRHAELNALSGFIEKIYISWSAKPPMNFNDELIKFELTSSVIYAAGVCII